MRSRNLILVLGLLCALPCALFGFITVMEWPFAQADPDADPEPTSLADLLDHGPSENRHIVLKDFVFCANCAALDNQGWFTKVFIPVEPKALNNDAARLPHPRRIRMLIDAARVHNQAELDRYYKRTDVQGFLISASADVWLHSTDRKSDIKRQLLEDYPETDFSDVLVLVEGRKPTGKRELDYYLWTSIGFGILGVALVTLRILLRSPVVVVHPINEQE